MDNDAVIAEFCSITDQNFDTARDFLAAHDWQLEAALNTFFHDPAPPAFAGAGAARVPLAKVATAAAGGQASLGCSCSRCGPACASFAATSLIACT